MQAEASDCFVIVDAGVLLFVTSYRIPPFINVLAFVTLGATLALAGCATLPDAEAVVADTVAGPVILKSVNNPVSPTRSHAILHAFQSESGGVDILQKHQAVE